MYRGYLVTVEARPSGELRLRRPFPATAITAVASKASLPIRFMSFQPVNAASAQRCKDTLR